MIYFTLGSTISAMSSAFLDIGNICFWPRLGLPTPKINAYLGRFIPQEKFFGWMIRILKSLGSVFVFRKLFSLVNVFYLCLINVFLLAFEFLSNEDLPPWCLLLIFFSMITICGLWLIHVSFCILFPSLQGQFDITFSFLLSLSLFPTLRRISKTLSVALTSNLLSFDRQCWDHFIEIPDLIFSYSFSTLALSIATWTLIFACSSGTHECL